MRCTLGTVVATAAVILIATAFWPQNPAVNLPPQLVAQDRFDSENNKKQTAKPKPASKTESPEAKIERVLDDVTELDLVDMPLNDVIKHIRILHGINIMLDTKVLENVGFDTSVLVNFSFSGLKLRSALKIILEQLAEPLTYIIEDEVMKITTVKEADTRVSIQVYPVGDLLKGVEGKLVIRGQAVVPVETSGGGGGFFSVNEFNKNRKNSGQPQVQQGGVVVYRQSPGEALMEVITSTVQPKSWVLYGGDGSIEEFNGLLVARASQDVHREIKNLLEMMREAAKENNGRKKAAPTAAAGAGRFGAGAGSKGIKFFTPGGFDFNTAGDFGTSRKKPDQEPFNRQNRNVPESIKKE